MAHDMSSLWKGLIKDCNNILKNAEGLVLKGLDDLLLKVEGTATEHGCPSNLVANSQNSFPRRTALCSSVTYEA